MKKLLLTSIFFAASSANAGFTVSGYLDTLYAGYEQTEGIYSAAPWQTANVSYDFELNTRCGTWTSAVLTLNGTFSTISPDNPSPSFAQQTVTFTNARYGFLPNMDFDEYDNGYGYIDNVTPPGPPPAPGTIIPSATFTVNGGVADVGDQLQDVFVVGTTQDAFGNDVDITSAVDGGTLFDGTVDCVTGTGDACTGMANSFFDNLPYLTLTYSYEFPGLDILSNDLAINFLSETGDTGFILNGPTTVPVPAAAWLFG